MLRVSAPGPSPRVTFQLGERGTQGAWRGGSAGGWSSSHDQRGGCPVEGARRSSHPLDRAAAHPMDRVHSEPELARDEEPIGQSGAATSAGSDGANWNSDKVDLGPHPNMQTGVVVSLKDSYGFIRCAERDQRLFFHFTGLEVRDSLQLALVPPLPDDFVVRMICLCSGVYLDHTIRHCKKRLLPYFAYINQGMCCMQTLKIDLSI